jgi:hypothetical protein
MRDFFRTLLALFMVVSAFFVGFHFGRSKEKAKIPNFQEDLEGHV